MAEVISVLQEKKKPWKMRWTETLTLFYDLQNSTKEYMDVPFYSRFHDSKLLIEH